MPLQPKETTRFLDIFRKRNNLREHLDQLGMNTSVGYVPTMGALHDGHISLLRKAREENDRVVTSIFVNPEQFNDPNDLKNYPRTLENDIQTLENEGCDILFAPTEGEVYQDKKPPSIQLNGLDEIMEGQHRPGHFKGVLMVLERLFHIIQPHKAYFGQKDYQQFIIVRKMVEDLGLNIEVVGCPTVRNEQGLALSSRNKYLPPEQIKEACRIYQVLKEMRKNTQRTSLDQLKETAEKKLRSNSSVELEYLQIADGDTLESVEELETNRKTIAFVAAYIGNVRLIDNMVLYP